MSADTPELHEIAERIDRLELELKAIIEKYVPVSEGRLNKLWGAVRETIDTFSQKLVAYEKGQQAQNDKIATLSGTVENLTRQVIMLSIAGQDGMKVPDEQPHS